MGNWEKPDSGKVADGGNLAEGGPRRFMSFAKLLEARRGAGLRCAVDDAAMSDLCDIIGGGGGRRLKVPVPVLMLLLVELEGFSDGTDIPSAYSSSDNRPESGREEDDKVTPPLLLLLCVAGSDSGMLLLAPTPK